MIVEPDFLTHWKTQLLIDELDDKAAPIYVIALWAHCQQRRTDTFPGMSANALKAICRYDGDADKLRTALEQCGYLEACGDAVVVHGWAKTNVKLIANWENGKTGGRPKKPNGNPTETQTHFGLTQQEPNGNPTETQVGVGVTQQEPIREEKRREDKSRKDIVDHKCKEGVVGGDLELAINSDDKPEFGELPDAFRSTWPETFRVSVWDLAKRKFEWIKSLPGYSQADAATLLKIAACEACGQISEYFVDDACEGLRRARESPRNPVGYLYATLQRAMLEKKGVKLENIIGRVKLPTK